jgi:hypothetical protein
LFSFFLFAMARQTASRVRRPPGPPAPIRRPSFIIGRYVGCASCGHVRVKWLQQDVLDHIGEQYTSHSAEKFRLSYQISPCRAWPIYKSAARDLGIKLPGEDEEDDDDDDNDDDGAGAGAGAVAVEVKVKVEKDNSNPKNNTSEEESGNDEDSGSDKDSDGTNENSKRAAGGSSENSAKGGNVIATAATTTAATTSKKPKTGAEHHGVDNRPAWLVKMEREKNLPGNKADTPPKTPSMTWGKFPSTKPINITNSALSFTSNSTSSSGWHYF